MKTSIAYIACFALAAVSVHAQDAEDASEPIRSPKFVDGFRQAWRDDKPIGAFAFAVGKAVDVPKRVVEWIGGAGLAAKRAAEHAGRDMKAGITGKPVDHSAKPHHHHHHHHHDKKPKADKPAKEEEEDHKERSKLGQKFHDWKIKVIQWFKDQGCNAKDGWYLARHPEVDVSFCDKDGKTPEEPPKCDIKKPGKGCGGAPPKRPSPPKPQPPKGCNPKSGHCHLPKRPQRYHREEEQSAEEEE